MLGNGNFLASGYSPAFELMRELHDHKQGEDTSLQYVDLRTAAILIMLFEERCSTE
ncbi:hypothetical protein PISMIDRAFT_677939 [Pisolithus microcarpus 441]|uniref:Uncharacterized protein n=1 Tax=Pisolithus microcarpus 441 TaxID=765257 RepID=A0A0C9ZFU0_9AGAM|nr:hypothetical protein PISMIDRAFT_677939 [Pisolithus microcarpus 441]